MPQPKNRLIDYMPILGIIVFGSLYFYASTLYPGGSQIDLNSVGYDWVNNYWCNLLNEKGMNGQPNPARPIAILAMVILCLSLIQFFLQFASVIAKNKSWRQVIPISGMISMIFAIFIFTKYHDLMTILASFFGLFAVLGIILEIYKSERHLFKLTGVFAILLLGINNGIYYSGYGITYLPLLQKISFAIVLAWVGGLNLEMIKTTTAKSSNPIT